MHDLTLARLRPRQVTLPGSEGVPAEINTHVATDADAICPSLPAVALPVESVTRNPTRCKMAAGKGERHKTGRF